MSRAAVVIPLLLSLFVRSDRLSRPEDEVAPPTFRFQGVGEVKDEEEAKKWLYLELEGHDEVRRKTIHRGLKPMFDALPKNKHGNVGREAVRFAIHRYFLATYGMFIRGLEGADAKWTPVALDTGEDPWVMREWVPDFLQKQLDEYVGTEGVSLDRLAAMGAAIDLFIDREANGRLELSYEIHAASLDEEIDEDMARGILITYLVCLMSGGNYDAVAAEEGSFEKQLDNLEALSDDFERLSLWFEEILQRKLHETNNTFDRMKNVVHEMGATYYRLNEIGCGEMRQLLGSFASQKPGRIRLSAFYNASLYSNWKFIEATDFLKDLGELDDTDPANIYVIIPNYVSGRANCQDTSSIYTMCCINACEEFLTKIETDIGETHAKPEEIIDLVGTLTSDIYQTPREITPILRSRLQEVAVLHGGEVRIHSRMFSQWMHHVFPLDCPYPHDNRVNPLTMDDWMRDKEGKDDDDFDDEEPKPVKEKTLSTEDRQKFVESDPCAENPEGNPDCVGTAELDWQVWDSEL